MLADVDLASLPDANAVQTKMQFKQAAQPKQVAPAPAKPQLDLLKEKQLKEYAGTVRFRKLCGGTVSI